MLINFVFPLLISCAVINGESYNLKIDRAISEAFYNPYIFMDGLSFSQMKVLWKKQIDKSDNIMFQAYYLYNNEYKFVNYYLCATYSKNSTKKVFQDLTYQLFTAKQTCPIKAGMVVSPSAFNMTTEVKALPKCGKTEIKINGIGPVSKEYFSHFLYALIHVTITGATCQLKKMKT